MNSSSGFGEDRYWCVAEPRVPETPWIPGALLELLAEISCGNVPETSDQRHRNPEMIRTQEFRGMVSCQSGDDILVAIGRRWTEDFYPGRGRTKLQPRC